MTELTGGCACGRIRFTAQGAPRFAFICHCRACQRRSGTGHAAQAAVDRDSFSQTGSPGAWTRDSDSGHRVTHHFCRDCGSPLYNTMTRGPGIAMIDWGALDDPPSVAPDRVFEELNAAGWDMVRWHDYAQGAEK